MAVPENDLMTGAAELFASNGVGVFGSGVVPTADQTGIFLGRYPNAPDSVVAMAAFTLVDDPINPVGKIALHLQLRAPTVVEVNTIGQQIFDLFHGFTGPLGSVQVIQALRKISTPMGFDDSERWQRVDQYYVDVNTDPTTYRPSGGWQ